MQTAQTPDENPMHVRRNFLDDGNTLRVDADLSSLWS